MRLLLDEGWDRRVPAVWSVLDRYGGTSTLVLYRNTWPPEPGATYNLSEHGVVWAGGERFDVSPTANDRDDRGDTVSRLQWTWPPRLFERVGLLPHTSSRPRTWRAFAADRTAAAAVTALAAVEQTDLTMWTIHSPDKSEHLMWCSVQPTTAPLDVDALLAQAAAWTGPVEGDGWLYGTVASQNLEADLRVGTLLGVRHYDYVMLLSDHAMSHNTRATPFCGRHEEPPAFLGIFTLAGPGIRAGADLGTLSPLDVAPTLAYLLGLPVSQALPGRVVTEAFTAEHLASHPIRTVPGW